MKQQRFYLYVLVCIALIAILLQEPSLADGAPPPATSGLIANRDFETGDLTGWTGDGKEKIIDSSHPHSGKYALYNPGSLNIVQQQVTGLQPGTTYLLTVWGRMARTTTGNHDDLYVQNYGGNRLIKFYKGADYKQYSILFTTGPHSTSAEIGQENLDNTTIGSYTDDFSLTVAPSVGVAAGLHTVLPVGNPGFEDGNLLPWYFGGKEIGLTNTNTHTGNSAVCITGNWCGVFQTISNLQPNTTYTVIAWGRLVEDIPGDHVGIYVNKCGGRDVRCYFHGVHYTQYTITFTTGPNATSAEIGCSNLDGSNVGAYVDDFAFGMQ